MKVQRTAALWLIIPILPMYTVYGLTLRAENASISNASQQLSELIPPPGLGKHAGQTLTRLPRLRNNFISDQNFPAHNNMEQVLCWIAKLEKNNP